MPESADEDEVAPNKVVVAAGAVVAGAAPADCAFEVPKSGALEDATGASVPEVADAGLEKPVTDVDVPNPVDGLGENKLVPAAGGLGLAKSEEPALACVEAGTDGLNAGENTLSVVAFAGAKSAAGVEAGADGLEVDENRLAPAVFAEAKSVVVVGGSAKLN